MVAIVSGNNLGLNLGSLASLGQRGQIGSAKQGQSGERAYVNVSNGQLVLQDLDAMLVGLGPDAAALRTYNSRGVFDYDNNDGWQGATKSIQKLGAVLRRYDNDGSSCDYTWDQSRQLYVATVSAGSARDTIVLNQDGTYTFTDGATGAKETYQSAQQGGRILSASDTSGNTLTYGYEADLLVSVTDQDGESVSFVYGGVSGRDLLEVKTTIKTPLKTDQVVSLVSYGYDSRGRLWTVSVNLDPEGKLPAGSEMLSQYTTTYGYEGDSDRVSLVTQSDGTSLAFTYVQLSPGEYVIETVTDGNKQVTHFGYDVANKTTTVIDPLQVATVYKYDDKGQLTEIRSGVTASNPLGLSRLVYAYNDLGDVKSITDGLGNTVAMQYDANGNLTNQVDSLGNSLVRTYNAQNQVLTETVNGVRASGGGAPGQLQTTRYVYDASGKNHLRFVISPEGRVTEYQYDTRGLRTSAVEYSSASFDATALATTEVPSEATMQAWAAAQDLSRTARVDTAYDFRGQVESVTTYEAVDAAGLGVAATATATQYVYDPYGRLEKTITPAGDGITQTIYDGLGRVVLTNPHSANKSLSTPTFTRYDDAGGKVTVTLANGLVTTSAFDKAGRLVSVMQSSAGTGNLGTTRYAYDLDGRLLMTEDPTGRRSWLLYDAAGRKVGEIDAAGALTEYVYNAGNQVTQTIRYNTAVDVTKLADANGTPTTGHNPNPNASQQASPVNLAAIRPVATSNDARSWNLYDDAGRLTWQVDALGYVTHTEYDGASRVLAVTRFATPIDPGKMGSGTDVALAVNEVAAPVELPSTTTQLSAVVSGSGANAPRILTAVVACQSGAGAAQPTGYVTFFSGQVVLGWAPVVAGVATLEARNLPRGTNSITAVYSGDQGNSGSTSNAVVDTVTALATTVTVAPASASAAGASLELKATVVGQSPTGAVAFYCGGVPIGTAALLNGVATLKVNNLPVGHNAVTATYLGDSNNAGSTSSAVDQVIERATTTTIETVVTGRASNAESDAGAPVTLTAVVGGSNPTGTVTFYAGQVSLGTQAVVNGIASLVVALPAGSQALTAQYSGDDRNAPSVSAVVTESVFGAPTVVLTATLMVAGPNSGRTAVLSAIVGDPSATGAVCFFNGAILIGSAPIVGGRAVLALAPSLSLAPGGLKALYSGDAGHSSSSSAAVTSLTPVTTSEGALGPAAAVLAPIQAGPVGRIGSLSIQVSSPTSGAVAMAPTPTGTVTFFDGNMNLLGTAKVVNGVATLANAELPVGINHPFTATYSGDAYNGTSTIRFEQTVTRTSSTTSLTASPAGFTAQSAPVLLTARVTGSDPRGTVSFYRDSTLLGKAAVSNGYAAIAVSDLPVGTNNLMAIYQGDWNNTSSTSTIAAEQVVAAPVYATLASSSPMVRQGEPLTLTAHVSGNRPSGEVAFMCGTSYLGSAQVVNGLATLTLARVKLPPGSHSIVAVYAGDARNSKCSSSPATQTVTPGTTPTIVSRSETDRTASTIYDKDGWLRAVIDGEGYLTETRYDAAGRPVEEIRYAQKVPGFKGAASISGLVADARSSGSLSKLLPKADPADIHTFSYYNARGQRVAEVDGEGYLTETVYDANGRMAQTIRYARPANGPITATSALPALRPTSNNADHSSTTTWDALGRLWKQTNAEGTVTEYTYDKVGNCIETTVALATEDQRKLLARYDVQGRLTAELSAVGAALLTGDQTSEQVEAIWRQYATSYTYDAAGRRTSSTDANGNRTVFFFDDVGRLRYTVNALGEVTEQQYDALGHVKSTTQLARRLDAVTLAALGGGLLSSPGNQSSAAAFVAAEQTFATNRTTVYAYDALGRRTGTVVDPNGLALAQEFKYDANGNLAASTDANKQLTRYVYDNDNRLIYTLDAAGGVRKNEYDAAGRIIRATAYGAPIDLSELGREVSASDIEKRLRAPPKGQPDEVVQNVYDRDGRLTFTVDGEGGVTRLVYNANGNVIERRTYAERIVLSSWDPKTGEPPVVEDGLRDMRVRTVYDKLNRAIFTIDGTGAVVAQKYDKIGNVLERVAYARCVPVETQATASDLSAAVERIADAAHDAHVRFVYDADNRLTWSVDGTGAVTQQVVDANGNLVKQVAYAEKVGPNADPRTVEANIDDRVSINAYDRANQLVYSVDALGGVRRYVYDENGNLLQTTAYSTRIAAPNPRAAALSMAEIEDALNKAGALTGEKCISSSAYDLANRKKFSVDAEGAVVEYMYDGVGRVIASTSYANTIPPGTAPAQKQDSSGDFTGRPESSAGDRTTLNAYDAAGRIVFTVDALGYVQKTTYDGVGRATSRTLFPCAVEGTMPGMAASDIEMKVVQSWMLDSLRIGVVRPGQKSSYEYDSAGNLVAAVDPLGKTERYTYNGGGEKTSFTDKRGATWQYDYWNFRGRVGGRFVIETSPSASLTSVADGSEAKDASIVTWLEYDALGNLISRTEAVGRSEARTTSYDYDASSRLLTKSVDPFGIGVSTHYQYNVFGEIELETNASGIVTENTYDAKGELRTQTVSPVRYVKRGLNLVTSYEYDTYGRIDTVTSPGGTVTKYAYDKVGRRTSVVVEPNRRALGEEFKYDANGNMVASVDRNKQVTKYVYDADNRLVFTVNAAGGVKKTEYDAAGRVVRAIAYGAPITGENLVNLLDLGRVINASDVEACLQAAPEGQPDEVVRNVYDLNGRLTFTVDGEGGVTQRFYDANGNEIERRTYADRIVLSEWDPKKGAPSVVAQDRRDRRERTIYDALNRAIFTIDGSGAVVEQKYDGNGNVVERIAYATQVPIDTAANAADLSAAVKTIADATHDAHIRRIYDAAGRLIWSVDGAGAVTQQVFDGDGNLVKQVAYANRVEANADPRTVGASESDRVNVQVYDQAGRLACSVDALGGVTGHIYDRNGNVVMQIAYSTRISRPTSSSPLPTLYDIPSGLDSANARISSSVYDSANRRVFGVDAEGAVTEYQYDGAGRVIKTTAYAQTITPGTAPWIDHDGGVNGRPTASAADRTTFNAYDAAGRILYAVDALGYVQETKHDGVGRVVSRTLHVMPLRGLEFFPSVTPALIAKWLEAQASHSQATTGALPPDQTSDLVYDSVGNLVGTVDGLGYVESYDYNGVGEKTSFTNKKGATWHYDYLNVGFSPGRLVIETSPTVSLTSVDNDASRNLVESGTDDDASIVTWLEYDALGNLLSRTEAVGRSECRTTRYEYDAAGRQVKTIFPTTSIYNAAADEPASNGANGLARPSESSRELSTQVFYNSFGNAVANLDVAGNVSYKIYDALGQVLYDVDAAGYVTKYERDTFGDVKVLKRYAQAVDLKSYGTSEPDASTVAQMLKHSDARAITTEYDSLGRATKVTQPAVWVFNGKGQSYLGAAVVRTTYDAFGQAVEVKTLVDQPTDTWATTTHYFDKRGQEVASVDAMGFVTTLEYDAAGNIKSRVEYANPSTAWDVASFSLPEGSEEDRKTVWEYDKLNRKQSETRVNVEYSVASDGTSTRGDLTTIFGYDEVGNLVRTEDALGNVTNSYYDALGRTTAVVAPSRPVVLSDGSTADLRPVTLFKRDAYGNVVATIERANGVVFASDRRFVLREESAEDRETLSSYDKHGHVTQTTDAEGNSSFASYDAAGHLAKQWRTVTSDDGSADASTVYAHTLYTVFEYDAIGRQTAIITPASTSELDDSGHVTIVGQETAGSLRTVMEYNAYGEMEKRYTTGKGAPEMNAEFFGYDQAGRLWRTNSGDGNTKVYLYDQRGCQTSVITSAGSAGTSSLGVILGPSDRAEDWNAQQVDQLDPSLLRRTDTEVDLLGRAEKQTLPTRKNPWSPEGEGNYRPMVIQGFDRWGNIVTQSDVRDANRVTSFSYNANNQVIKQVQPEVAVLNSKGETEHKRPTTEIYYDAVGRKVAMRDARGNVNGQAWDGAGQLTMELHADNGKIVHSYDTFGEQVGLDQNGNVTTYEYDKMGRNTKVHSPLVDAYVRANTYDYELKIQSGISLTTIKAYDEAGRQVRETNPNEEMTRCTYDARGNLVATRKPMGQTTKATFDANGKQTANEDGNGNVMTWKYDGFGLLLEHEDFVLALPSAGQALQDTKAVPGARVKSLLIYDNARQMIEQSNDRGTHMQDQSQNKNQSYRYDAAGQLVEIQDHAIEQTTRYSYDKAGRHAWEWTSQSPGTQAAGGPVVQNQVLNYDELGRLRRVTGLDGVDLRFDYDEAGNKMRESVAYNIQSTSKNQDLWFAYDSMNRQCLVDGAENGDVDNREGNLSNGRGHILEYDKNGNRISDTYKGKQVSVEPFIFPIEAGLPGWFRDGLVTEEYEYDRMGRLTKAWTNGYDHAFNAAGQVTLATRGYDKASRAVLSGGVAEPKSGWLFKFNEGQPRALDTKAVWSFYDPNGRIIVQQTRSSVGPSDHLLGSELVSWADYESYDDAGNLKAYSLLQTSGDGRFVDTHYQNSQLEYDGYREAVSTGRQVEDANPPSSADVGPTSSRYDANGFLVSIKNATNAKEDRSFINDVSGHVLLKRQVEWKWETVDVEEPLVPTPIPIDLLLKVAHERFLRQLVVDGNVIGVYGEGVDPNKPTNDDGTPRFDNDQGNFDLNFQRINGSAALALSAGQYQVQAGDTLQGIAQSAYGDASLWYLVANANGLRGNEDLRIGQTLTIPARVGGMHNSASTFRPYDPSRIVGDTTPNLPMPQDNSDDAFRTLGAIIAIVLIIVVTVVVTVYTAGAASALLAGQIGALSSLGGTMAAGGAALAGAGLASGAGATAAAIAGAAIGGAVGSMAGQGMAMLLGMQEEWSWGDVALGGLGAGLGAGLGVLGSAASKIKWVSNWATKLGTVGKWAWDGARTAMVSAATQKIGSLLKPENKFEWGNVAATAVGGMVGGAVARGLGAGMKGPDLDLGQFGKSLAVGAISGFAGGLTTAVMKGGKFDVIQVATDAFGNALGGSLTAAMLPPSDAPSVYEEDEHQRQREQAPGALGQEPRPQAELRDTSAAAPMGVDEEVGQSANQDAPSAGGTGGPLGILRSMVPSMVSGAAKSDGGASGANGSDLIDPEIVVRGEFKGREDQVEIRAKWTAAGVKYHGDAVWNEETRTWWVDRSQLVEAEHSFDEDVIAGSRSGPTIVDGASEPNPTPAVAAEVQGAQQAEGLFNDTDLGATARGWLDSAQGWAAGLWDSAYHNVNAAAVLGLESPEYLAGYASGNRLLGSMNGAMYNSDIGKTTRDYWFATPGRSATLGGLMGGVNALVPVADVNRLPENMRSAFRKGELVVGSLAMAETLATGVPTLIDKAKQLYKTLTRPPVPPALAPALVETGGGARGAAAADRMSEMESFPNSFESRALNPQAPGLRAAGAPSEDVAAAKKPSTLAPGQYAKESIPAHRGRPTASEQRDVNKLMEKHGCHTCGTKNPGTKSGNAVADHQPPQALDEPKKFLPHCIECQRRQGGEVLQELLKRRQ